MISVTEAKQFIQEHVKEMQPVVLKLPEAAGKILAEDVFASVDIPAFDQSAMDGYAFIFYDVKNYDCLEIVGEMQAGTDNSYFISNGKAVRIFTGAPLPAGADTVVMQEKAKNVNGCLVVEDEKLKQGGNVRLKGSEIKSGELALKKDTLLTAGAIGFLAGIGINKVKVYPNPSVTIVVTGKELQQPGNDLKEGQVFESNSYSLGAAIKKAGIEHVTIKHSDDNLQQLIEILTGSLQNSDVVLLTGGVSVGDYDFVLQAAEACSVKKVFHKVKQRPGKPLFFGTKEEKIIFGLPGNPSSVLTCFYEFVLPAFSLLTKQSLCMRSVLVPLKRAVSKAHPLTHFLKAFYNGETVEVLDAQESYRMFSFAIANCLVQLNEDMMKKEMGDSVEIHLLPQ